MNTNDLWKALGSMDDEQSFQVLTQLFARYEQPREQHPDAPAKPRPFFRP